MSALFEDIPAMPLKTLQMRRELHNRPGLHNLFDTPVQCFEQHAPASNAFEGEKISVLMYTTNARFCLAVGDLFGNPNESEYLEFTSTANNNIQYTKKDIDMNHSIDHPMTPAAKTFYWVQFLKNATSISLFLDDHLLSEVPYTTAKPIPLITGVTAWPTTGGQGILCFECHFTCDPSKVCSLFPMNTWLNLDSRGKLRSFQQSVNFKQGGSMTIRGTYKKTGQSDKIRLGLRNGSTDTTADVDPPSDPSPETMLHLTIEGGNLVLVLEGKQRILLTGVDGSHTIPVKVIENFVIKSVFETSGMINPQCRRLPDNV
ncbi:uncharacterized protein LOC135375940 [Ornithodoros turicata]|uniref:uncharacterized protein LOC135375940 n=1 Tax=Ornithodoros turicata TaxID=34597 RepID=UPI0031396EB5